MPPANQKRVQVDVEVSLPPGLVGMATIKLTDQDGQAICWHCFCYPTYGSPLDTPDWFNAQMKVAQAIADAINAAPNAAIEYIRKAQRESSALQERVERKTKS